MVKVCGYVKETSTGIFHYKNQIFYVKNKPKQNPQPPLPCCDNTKGRVPKHRENRVKTESLDPNIYKLLTEEIGNSTLLVPLPLPRVTLCPKTTTCAPSPGTPQALPATQIRSPLLSPGSQGPPTCCSSPPRAGAPQPLLSMQSVGSGGTEQQSPGQGGHKGVSKTQSQTGIERKKTHFSVCTAGSSNEKKQKKGRGEETGNEQELHPEPSQEPARLLLQRPPECPPAPNRSERGPCAVPSRSPRRSQSRGTEQAKAARGKRSRGSQPAGRCPRAGGSSPGAGQGEAEGCEGGGSLFTWLVW